MLRKNDIKYLWGFFFLNHLLKYRDSSFSHFKIFNPNTEESNTLNCRKCVIGVGSSDRCLGFLKCFEKSGLQKLLNWDLMVNVHGA